MGSMGEEQHAVDTGSGDAPLKELQQQEQAAQVIQRNYRGYRERRQLKGIGLSASTRWSEVGDHSFCLVMSKRLLTDSPGPQRRLAVTLFATCIFTKPASPMARRNSPKISFTTSSTQRIKPFT